MTVAQFESPGGSPRTQALRCFRQLKDFLDALGLRLEATSNVVVEITHPSGLDAAREARRTVFGNRRPRTLSNRFTRLPAGEWVRVTVRLDQPTPASGPTADSPRPAGSVPLTAQPRRRPVW